VCREATVLVALSAFQRNHTQKTLPDLRNVMVVIPRGVDLSRFSYRERTITSPVRFLHIASNQPFKDHTNLFRAFSIIRREIDCSMQIIGEGFDTDEIQRLLVTLNIGDDVSFVGMVKNTSLAAYFSEAHILLHSSRLEGLPGVALEAMASGVPVCSTAVGLLVDLGDPLVCLAPVNDPVSLANQTLALIRDSDRYRRQQQAARAYAVNHDASWSTKEYIQLFYSTTTT
jgi:glycosyltransferase involved in cell wall biosynthesis